MISAPDLVDPWALLQAARQAGAGDSRTARTVAATVAERPLGVATVKDEQNQRVTRTVAGVAGVAGGRSVRETVAGLLSKEREVEFYIYQELSCPPKPNSGRSEPGQPIRAATPATPATSATALLVSEWRAGFDCLSPDVVPCPGLRRWHAIYASARAFLERDADEAAALGWTTLELFGCHPIVGVYRPDCTGAMLMSGGGRVADISRNEIRRAASVLVFRKPPLQAVPSIPVWECRSR